jgi:hypothetical protein
MSITSQRYEILHRSLGGRKLQTKWIEGHQDEDKTYEDLTTDARLNVDVDKLASEYFWSGSGTRPSPNTPHRVAISINGTIYPTKIDDQIRYHFNGSYLKEFLTKKHGWSESTWDAIDFSAFGRHFKSLSGAKRIQHMKLVHDLQPLGAHREIDRLSDDETLQMSVLLQRTRNTIPLAAVFKQPRTRKSRLRQ